MGVLGLLSGTLWAGGLKMERLLDSVQLPNNTVLHPVALLLKHVVTCITRGPAAQDVPVYPRSDKGHTGASKPLK